MPRKKVLSDEIREQVVAIVTQFNKENTVPPEANPMRNVLKRLGISSLASPRSQYQIGEYVPSFRGAYLYLDRVGYDGRPSKICRLKWAGAIDNWEFAIYKYSDNGYDPDDWFFPGAGEVDGTVTGAMKAGNEAYPI